MATEAIHDENPEEEAPAAEEVTAAEEEMEVEAKEKEETDDEEEEADKENHDPEAEEERVDDGAEEVANEVEVEAEEGGAGRKRARRGRKKEVSRLKGDEDESEMTPEKKEPVTPSSDRPTRERKSVERYSASSAGRPTPSKVLSIEKGSGTQLKDIPNVAFKLSKRKADENLQVLHSILFGKKAKVHSLKRNISQFSGFVWDENEEKQRAKVREKLDKCVKEKLVDFCDVLNIQINKATLKKEEISARLLEFLESPHATTDILLADKEQKAKIRKKAASGKRVSTGEVSKDTPAKRQKTSEGGKKRRKSSKSEDVVEDKADSPEAKDDSHEDSDNEESLKEKSDHVESKSDEEDKEEDEQEEMSNKKSPSKKLQKETSGAKSKDKPKPVKKVTPEKSLQSPTKSDANSGPVSKSKGSASKKQKVEKESPKVQRKGKSSKKSKPEPNREEMLEVVEAILQEVDFNTATLSDILRRLGTHFGVDLMHRKAEVKAIITEVIHNMSDASDEDDSDDNEAGDEKDGDGDA